MFAEGITMQVEAASAVSTPVVTIEGASVAPLALWGAVAFVAMLVLRRPRHATAPTRGSSERDGCRIRMIGNRGEGAA